ncbi:MAG: M16 family metallopeptidase [Brevinematia bacterium]
MASKFDDVLKTIDENRYDFVLDNGLSVIIFDIKDAKSVNILLGINAGSLNETKPGIAYLTSQVLLFKNKKYNMLEIPNYIESLGGNIYTSSGHDMSSVQVQCLEEDIYDVLDKLLDIFIGFEVDNEVLDIVKPSLISKIKAKEDDPWEYTRKIFLKELYGDHPYGREPEGDEVSIESITSEEIMRFFRDFYTPDNAVLVIVGKVEKEKIIPFLKESYSKWYGKRTNYDVPLVNVGKSKNEVKVRKDLKQSTVRIGHLSTNVKDRNRVELKVLNYILGGGGFGSRLMEKVREKEGLAYGITSNFYIDRKLEGYFFVGTQTENKNVRRVIEIITNQIKEIVEKGITQEELEDTKNFLRGSLILSMESFSTIASFLVSEKIFGIEKNYFVKDIERISVIKKEDIERVAKEYLKPENLLIVVVGGE